MLLGRHVNADVELTRSPRARYSVSPAPAPARAGWSHDVGAGGGHGAQTSRSRRYPRPGGDSGMGRRMDLAAAVPLTRAGSDARLRWTSFRCVRAAPSDRSRCMVRVRPNVPRSLE